MEENDPRTAAAFHQFMACLIAQRLLDTDRTLETLLD
jgi:hypothetical protein